MEYLVPLQYGEAEFVEKRSRFIGQVWQIATEEEARQRIAETKAKYHDARHNCWCFSLRDSGIQRYADDGEPQGTAGQPMLEVFRRNGIENALCVVTRYFGGILLGTGGLTRAYANTAKLALDTAGVAMMRLWSCMDIVCPYSLLERIKNEIDAFGGTVERIDYSADVAIGALFSLEQAPMFSARLKDITSGEITGTVIGEKYLAVKL